MTQRDAILEAAAAARGCDRDELIHWRVDNPYFRRWSIWRVHVDELPPSPLHVAAYDDEAHVVSLDDGLRTLTNREPVSLGSAEEAIAYVRFFVALARPTGMTVLDGIDDVPGVRQAKKTRWSDVITPPTAAQGAEGFRVEAYVLDRGNLTETRFDVDRRGAIRLTAELLEERLSVFRYID